jgi:POT family proton-dependent oligopeptide transporter
VFKKHPRGLPVLFFTEMWERFGFYLMLGILVLYMVDTERNGLGFGVTKANEVYGWFIALVYLTPFAGGILADRYLGYRRSIVLGGLLMAAGYLGLGILPGVAMFYLSLALIVLGNGFFKPNISSIVGRLYPAGSPLKDTGYNIFYMGINIGAFVCNFVAAILRNRYGWGFAFVAAGIGMLAGVIIFLAGQKQLGVATDRGDGSKVESGVLGKLVFGIFLPALAAGVVGWALARALHFGGFFTPTNTGFLFAVVPIVSYYVLLWARSPLHEKRPIGALLAIFAVVIVFWMIFHQNGNTLTLWAEAKTDRDAGRIAGVLRSLEMHQEPTPSYWEGVPPDRRPAPGSATTLISPELFQSINPMFIVLLTPVVVGAFAMLRRRGREPSTPAKIGWGLVLTALSTLIMVMAVSASRGGTLRVSPWWLVGTYGVISIGELCLSPMGLSLVSKLAPARVTAVMMGGWFLSTSLGNKLAGVVGGLWEQVDSLATIFWINGLSALGAAALIFAMVPWIRGVMSEHDGRAVPPPPAAPGPAARPVPEPAHPGR